MVMATYGISGEINYGSFAAGTTNNNAVNKTEVAPGGDIVDIWVMYWNVTKQFI